MKRLLSLFLALSLMLALVGCLPVSLQQLTTQPTISIETEAATEQTPPPTTEATEPVATEQTLPTPTQPPQEAEIIDDRPHPSDIVRPTETVPPQEAQPEETTEAATEPPTEAPTEAPTEPATEAPTEQTYPIDPNGYYTSRDQVALYIHTFGRLPSNYISKTQGENLYGSYKNIPSYMNIGGDRFYNREGLLPQNATYYECDIGTSGGRNRGSKRIVFSTDGAIYYTSDHYESFTRLY